MTKLDAAQVEQLKTIGEYLYSEREARAIPLEEVAVRTFIPLRLLQALEVGQVDRLPEPIFVQGFIRRYADTIGLDGMALSKTFNPEPAPVVIKPLEVEPVEVLQPPHELGTPLPPRPVESAAAPQSIPPYLSIALAGVALLLIGVGAFSLLNRPRSVAPSSASSSAATQQALRPSSSSSAPKSASAGSNAPVQATIELKDDSWMQIIADGKTEYEGILKKGNKKTWSAKKSLVIQAGNAGAVLVSYNQEAAKLLGAPGEVKDIAFPP
ncbi:DUF4115 domain-containing protein [Leptolyngbya sp. FACHB-36]|uniref:helix-turn-helix domain-containing protein n=1 Tax=Leptolyngbya sp. FACHB-36 TaxID=2692808 RepID=UPI001680F804|nr:RodZ domain-containing protein [Leptolyngbya sp. FACHB-36]MBD2020954.1 DUF4115 domain-containing protein [Leptolyngbya sp. FACHB-36]